MTEDSPERPPLYQRIYEMVRQDPARQGRHLRANPAWWAVHATPRMVGYSMAALQEGTKCPAKGDQLQSKISPHGFGYGSALQRQILEEEGVVFDLEGKVDFNASAGWAS